MNFESLGVFGFSWQEIIARNIGYPVTVLNASTYGGIVNQQYKLYKQYVPPLTVDGAVRRIAEETGQSDEMTRRAVNEFMKKDSGLKILPANAEKTVVFDPFSALSGLARIAPLVLTVAAIGYAVNSVMPLWRRART